MSERFSRLISTLFHPVFMQGIGFALLFVCIPWLRSIYNPRVMLLLVVLYAVNAIVLPMLLVLLLRHNGYLQSLHMNNREERRWPLLLISLAYTGNFYLFQRIGLNGVILHYLLGSAAVLILATLINIFYKISLHGLGTGALLGLVFALSGHSSSDLRPLFVLLCLLTGLVAMARFRAGAHTRTEWYMGNLLGFVLMWVAFHFR